jgi:hypothetical protein
LHRKLRSEDFETEGGCENVETGGGENLVTVALHPIFLE